MFRHNLFNFISNGANLDNDVYSSIITASIHTRSLGLPETASSYPEGRHVVVASQKSCGESVSASNSDEKSMKIFAESLSRQTVSRKNRSVFPDRRLKRSLSFCYLGFHCLLIVANPLCSNLKQSRVRAIIARPIPRPPLSSIIISTLSYGGIVNHEL